MRHVGIGLLVVALFCGCDDETGGTSKDGPGGGDAATGDGTSTGDGAKTGDGNFQHDGAGWVTYDGGPVKVGDGGTVIVEDGGTKIICYKTTCAGKLLECGDCIDNDGDGLTDWRDPECLGPCDNTEGPALIAGVGGDTGTSCGIDCYFDYGNGPGNDDCLWDHRCDKLEPEKDTCPYNDKIAQDPKKCPTKQSQQCLDFCLPYTPNGCDCFGCCTFPQLAGKGPGGTDGFVWIGAFTKSGGGDAGTGVVGTCTIKDVLDPQKCPPCTPDVDCLNPCGKCEVCVGKPLPPPECFKKDAGPPTEAGPKDGSPGDGSTTSPQCPGGQQPCGLPGQAGCPQGYYCISGCCIKVDIS